jgi:hypothetical protein
MLVRALITLLLTAVIAPALARQDRTRASVSPLVFVGMVLAAASAAHDHFVHGLEIAPILLLQRPVRGLDDLLFEEPFLMLGYALVLGALLALPWLTPSSTREVASELGKSIREEFFSKKAGRKFLARRMPFWLGLVVILMLWRWIGARYFV